MWVTILTPLFNGIEYFEECYNSIIKQTNQDFVWLIGINGHGDTTNEIYKKLSQLQSDRIIVKNYETKGKVHTLNEMIKDVNTDYVALLDVDDMWFPNKLEVQKQILDTYPNIDVLGTNLQYIGELNHVPSLPVGVIHIETLFQINPVVNSSVVIKKEVAFWRDDFSGLEDYDLWFRCVLDRKTIVSIPQPLIYHRVYRGSAFNNSGVQDLETFMKYYTNMVKSVTIVSAYFPMKSKFSEIEYLHWIQFWGNVNCNLVFFTTKEFAPIIEKIREKYTEKTKIVIMELNDLVAFQKYGSEFWIQQKNLDHEQYHSPSLYAIWYEKKEFVRKAIQQNYFNTNKFIWCDAGICRKQEWIQHTKSFGNGFRIPNDRFLVLRITDFDSISDPEPDLQNINCVGGGILAATKENWIKFADDYDVVMKEFIEKNKFVGKDQTIIATMYLKNKDFFTLFPRYKELNDFDAWFSLLFYLSS